MTKSIPFHLQELIHARKGVGCVYWEKAVIVHAELNEIRLDDWGVRLQFRDLYTPGFTGDARPDAAEVPFWKVSAAWGVFSHSEGLWSAAYAGWSVYFDPQLIDSLREAAQGATGADWHSRYQTLVDCFRDHSKK